MHQKITSMVTVFLNTLCIVVFSSENPSFNVLLPSYLFICLSFDKFWIQMIEMSIQIYFGIIFIDIINFTLVRVATWTTEWNFEKKNLIKYFRIKDVEFPIIALKSNFRAICSYF